MCVFLDYWANTAVHLLLPTKGLHENNKLTDILNGSLGRI